MTTVHVIVGPVQHGVCRHGERVAAALGHEVVRVADPATFDPASVSQADVVHFPYTDRLFAERCEDSAVAFRMLVDPLRTRGQAISVTFHDLPTGDSPLDVRRRGAYAQVAAVARGIVVNSRQELLLLDRLDEHARSRRQISLPVERTDTPAVESSDEVVVLGFVFPDRGYEHTIGELPEGVPITLLGTAAAGHEDLVDRLSALCEARGSRLRITGFVDDADMPLALARTAVPIAPNRRVTASASIATWIAHGRRPLVPSSPYTRDLAAGWPGTVTLYDADSPGALRTAIMAAQANPASTYIASDTPVGPSIDAVAAAYAEHFETTKPDALLEVGAQRWAVPGNRWDLLSNTMPSEPPSVSVVIPYYEAQASLDRVLRSVSEQRYPLDRVQIVVADDGSAIAPSLGAAGDIATALVRQADHGFRAGAARNLGAAAADGDVLVFLDGDTSPEPDYLQRITRLPAVLPDTLAVGRRRHADFSQAPAVELSEPAWLVDAYRDSGNLLSADERSYRYFLGAVMAMHRELFFALDGFDETFTTYGGEDWELAHRAYVAGAVLAHVRDAVTWHDGPEWAERPDQADKNEETFTLTRLLPDAVTRGGGQWLPYPAVAVQLRATNASAALACVRSAFTANADCGFWIEDEAIVAALGDPRVRGGLVPAEVRARAVVVADIASADLSALPRLAQGALDNGTIITPAGTFTATRALHRAARWPTLSSTSLFGVREMGHPTAWDEVDLHHQLKKTYEFTQR